MRYVNVYEHHAADGSVHQFTGFQHPARSIADIAARDEMAVERQTKRIGVLRVRLKADA